MAKRPVTGGRPRATPKRGGRKTAAVTSTTSAPKPGPPAAQPVPPDPLAPLATGAPPPRSGEDTIKRIDELIKNARTTWFALLGALVFAAITLAGVKDVAFFVSDVETKLPLVGFSVPIVSFFWAGGLLTAALYIYFHLYLEQLWQELGDAPARIGADPEANPPDPGRPLADCIHPWLVSDTALRVRDWMRAGPEDNPGSARRKFIDDVLDALTATAGYVEVLLIRLFRKLFGALAIVDLPTNEPRASRRRGMGWISNLVSVSLVWLFGLAVIAWFWWRSMPAHNPLLTFWLGAVLAMTLWVFFKSIDGSLSSLSGRARPENWKPFFLVVLAAIVVLTTVRTWIDPWAGKERGNVFIAYQCTDEEAAEGKDYCWSNHDIRIDFLRPARADLREVVFTKKPDDWQGKAIAEAEFRLRWCKEQSMRKEKDCGRALQPGGNPFADTAEEKAFQSAWEQRWTALLASFAKPDLRGRDLRGADLAFASLEGANLAGASLNGADLSGASLDNADLSGASLDNANLSSASLKNANLFEANLNGADLFNASLERAELRIANLNGASLVDASLEGASLADASLNEANLSGASLNGADVYGASLNGADLSGTSLDGADVYGASFNDASLNGASLKGAVLEGASLENADLSTARLFGSTERRLEIGSAASLKAATIFLAALRLADLSGVDMAELVGVDESFGDGSVILPVGATRPPRWCAATLDDPEFFGRWRGYVDPDLATWSGVWFDNYPPIPPGPC